MKNGIFALDWGTIADAVAMAVLVSVVTAIYGVVTTTGFNVFTADWSTIGHSMINTGFVAAVISLAQNFVSTNSGSVLGITPNTSA
jgi:hypothetical protein